MMSSNKKTIYVCPRCNYTNSNRTDMKRHLYRVRLCPNKNGLYLTDEIREEVLNHHEYHPETQKPIQNNINNYNMMLGILNSMESLDKVKLLTDHQKLPVLDIEDDLEKKYEILVKRLETGDMTYGYFLGLDDLFNIVNNCTLHQSGEYIHFNVFFDKMVNRLKLWRGRSWETYLEDAGIKQLVSLIKSYYLDSYEIYLIRNLHNIGRVRINRWQVKDHLSIYYQFLVVFGLEPHIVNLDDDEVLGYNPKEGQSNYLATTYSKLYNEQKKSQKESTIKATKRKIVNIVKDNSIQNVRNLDKTIIELLKIDDNFKEELFKSRQLK